MAEVLAASDLRKTYGSTVALNGVSLALETGEVFGLVGPNGAGKTTLVRCLTGTTRPSEGSVSLFGDPVHAVDRARIGLLPQSFAPHERLTARELVSYYAGLYEDSQPPEAVLADVGMAEAADQPYLTLSGGQQRRVCVAIAVVNEPEILFLDEPTTGIDPAGRRSLWQLVSTLSEAGTTVLLTTHYMEEAERLADRVGLLADGRLVTVGSPADVIRRHGGKNRVIVETEASPEMAAESGFDVTVEASGLVFHDIAPDAVGTVVDWLDDHDIAYSGFRWAQPDLEEAYLRLTDGSNGHGSNDRPEDRA